MSLCAYLPIYKHLDSQDNWTFIIHEERVKKDRYVLTTYIVITRVLDVR